MESDGVTPSRTGLFPSAVCVQGFCGPFGGLTARLPSHAFHPSSGCARLSVCSPLRGRLGDLQVWTVRKEGQVLQPTVRAVCRGVCGQKLPPLGERRGYDAGSQAGKLPTRLPRRLAVQVPTGPALPACGVLVPGRCAQQVCSSVSA